MMGDLITDRYGKIADYEEWLGYVRSFSNAYRQKRADVAEVVEDAHDKEESDRKETPPKTIILCSPHPDDEVLTSALALRLLRQGDRVINIAITLGSDPTRKTTRKQELETACEVLGFECKLVQEPFGFDRISETAERTTESWQDKQAILTDLFFQNQPDLIILPHQRDEHPTHVGTHHLVMGSVMDYCVSGKSVLIVESEFWHPMREANILVGLSDEDVAIQITALSRHEGEISRNAFHLRHPARLMDSVRRGAETLSGYGQNPPDLIFGELYRLSKIKFGLVEFPKKYLISPHYNDFNLDLLDGLFLI